MDDILYDPNSVPIETTKYTGKLFNDCTDKIRSILLEIEHNIKMAGEYFDVDKTRELFIRYLNICDVVPYRKQLLINTRDVLVKHALSIPNETILTKCGNDEFACAVKQKVDAGFKKCEFGYNHLCDHIIYAYSNGSTLRMLNYFSTWCTKSVEVVGSRATISDDYEQCECGIWHRKLINLTQMT